MNYGRYNRAVMILSEQGRDFAAAEGRVAGYLKVETGNNKGAMRCSVENLRSYPKGDYIYKLILFGNRGERTIHSIIGSIPVSRSGNGEAYFRFNPLDVDGNGNGYEHFTTAIVAAVAMRSEVEPLHPVLKGDTGNEQGEARPMAASVSRDEETATENIQKEEGAPWEERAELPGEEKSEPQLAVKSKPEPVQAAQGQSVPAEKAKGAGKCGNFNRFYNEHVLHACVHTCQVAEFYEEVKPFSKDYTGARWKKIMNIMNLPLVSPGAHYFASLYHHYLFGARPDDRGYASSYFFGIPGRKLEAEQPDGGRSGFTYWQPMKGAEGQKNAYGYWIVEIDGQTGDIREVFIEKGGEM